MSSLSSKKQHQKRKNEKEHQHDHHHHHHQHSQRHKKSTNTSNSGKNKKRIYLIRHGESLGQVASMNHMDRKRDPRLMDAGLSVKGQRQAQEIPFHLEKLPQQQQQPSNNTTTPHNNDNTLENIDLIVSSPLTRAVHTALLGFQNRSATSNFIIHPHLREQGGGGSGTKRIPENQSRPIQRVLKDLQEESSRIEDIQFDLVLEAEKKEPHGTPKNKVPPKSPSAQDPIRDFLLWLYQERTEQVIAVVCHYNVIRSMLGPMWSPPNALPIPCELSHDGQIEPIL